MRQALSSKASLAVFLIAVLTLTGDGLVIFLGPQTLGVLMLLTTLMTSLAGFFWLLRFGDEQAYFRKNAALIFLALFFFAIGSLLAPQGNPVAYEQNILAAVSAAFMGPLRAALLVLGILVFAAFILVCAALDRN